MRALPVSLEAALATGVTTHCRCWLLIRQDGFTLGVTDHDADLVIAPYFFEANGGFETSDIEARSSLAAGGGEITGVLTSARITQEDIAAGMYDGAEIRTFLVDWSDPQLDFLIDTASIGEIRSKDDSFVAELRNSLHALDQEQGSLYTAACNAELGDARCGVDLAAPPFRVEGVVLATDGRETVLADCAAQTEPGFFTRGAITFTSGLNAGRKALIKDHRDQGELVFWQRMVSDLQPGDAFTLVAGCDKRFSTCRSRFGNALNFRGFPFIPAPEFVMTYARPGEGQHRGRPLVR
jgi:uncharacterized phage protein (TIGR02218 family)